MRKRMSPYLMDPNPEYRVKIVKKKDIHSVPSSVGVLVLLLLLALFQIVLYIDDLLPTPVTILDERTNPDAFVAERAQATLKLLTDNGPRVGGSYENEVLGVNVLKNKVIEIQGLAHKNQNIELDIQVVSGSYFLGFKPHGSENSYGNIQNVVVRLEGKKRSNSSIMANAHFDSVPTSPGASDDGIMCAVMLEVLQKLSMKSERPEHDIIFLFNGAEETPLHGSHGFISQHKWAKNIKVVINLEAGGSGGKDILFQTGPDHPWLMNYYRLVPHPHGQAAAEEIWQSNILPSDTDFRVFRDFGQVSGFDIAFNRNGYRYHTKYDVFSNIPLGSYQHAGGNALTLITNLGNAEELLRSHEKAEEKLVYYDFIGLFMISYKLTIAYVINILVVVVSVGVSVKTVVDFRLHQTRRTLKLITFTLIGIVAGWLFTILLAVALAYLLDGVGYAMCWYGNPWMIFGLYSAPSILISCGILVALNRFTKENNLSIGAISQMQAHISRLVWTVFLFIGTIMGIRAVYLLLLPILFNTLGFVIIQLMGLQNGGRKWQIIYLISSIIPTMFTYYMAIIILGILIPISGRNGSFMNADLIIAIVSVVFTILSTWAYIPLVTLIRNPMRLLLILLVVFVAFFIIVFTPLGFPYSGNPDSPRPQRQWYYHTGRIIHDENGQVVKKDSGFLIANMDRNSPASLYSHVKELERAVPIDIFCDDDDFLICGIPLYHSRMVQTMMKSTWVPSGEPTFNEPVLATLNLQTKISPNTTRYSITIIGPDHTNVYISPIEGFKVTAISTIAKEDFSEYHMQWKKRYIHFIKWAWGKQPTPLKFDVDVESSADWCKGVLEVVVCGHFMHHNKNPNTAEHIEFLSQFPSWTEVMPGLASYVSWKF